MTIALGLIASDGAILAADTEESWGERAEIKTATTTLMLGSRSQEGSPTYGIAIAGAGNSDYLDAVKLELVAATLGQGQSWAYEQTATMIEDYLLRFHQKHVHPLWPHITDFELLICIDGDGQSAMWGSTHTVLRPCVFRSDCIGAGRAYASGLLARFHTPSMDLASCAALAIHVIFCVREFIGGCGKQTQIVSLSNGATKHLKQNKVDDAERLFQRYCRLDSNLLHFVLGAADDMNTVALEAKEIQSTLKSIDLLN